MKKILVFVLFLSPLVTFGATYSNATRKFSFDYNDADWEVVPEDAKAPHKGADVDKAMVEHTLVSIQRKKADEKYRARFSVVVDDLKKAKSKDVSALVRYQNYAVDFLKSQRFSIVSTGPKKLPLVVGAASEVVAYQRDFGLTFHQIILLHSDEAYILTAAARTTNYDSYAKEIEKIVDSFHFAQ